MSTFQVQLVVSFHLTMFGSSRYSVLVVISQKRNDLVEKVRHRATKMIHRFSGMDHGERLRSLNMYSLGSRRTGGDLIQLFKFVKQGDM